MTGDRTARPHHAALREFAPVAAASLLARAAFMWFKGPNAYSIDLEAWGTAGALLARGGNPYAMTPPHLWPPFWVQILYGLQKIATAWSVPLIRIVPIFLIAAETVLIAVLLGLLRELGCARRRAIVLWGIALNPVCVILVCQHANFDVLVGLAVLVYAAFLLRYQRSRLPEDWLLACFWLGAGVTLKSVPIVLLPLLLSGSRALSLRVRALGAALTVGPVLYGLSILHVFHIAEVGRILGYRSVPGWFGATGWLHRFGRDHWMGGYSAVFTPALAVVCIAFAVAAYRGRLATPRRLIASAAFLLCFVVALGPGYGPQYFYWFWPLLLGSFALGTTTLRRIVLALGVLAAATYAVEYAFSPILGAFLSMRFPATRNLVFGDCPECFKAFILVRTPLWIGYLVTLWGLSREIRADDSPKPPLQAT